MSKAAATTVEERIAELKAEIAALEQIQQSGVSMEELDEIHDLLCHSRVILGTRDKSQC